MSNLAWRDIGGSGRPFVLVHGYTGSSDDFAHVVEPLTELRRIVLVDLPGHGDSPRAERYSLNAMTAAVAGLLETLGDGCDVLGHSMGGRVILPLAIAGSGPLRSLVLMDTWADAPDDGEGSDGMEALLALPDAEAAAAWERRPPEPATAETDLIGARWGQDWLTSHSAQNGKVDPLAVIQLAREFLDEPRPLLAQAGSIRCATTVVVGELDVPFLGPSQRLASTIPDAELVVIGGAYHSPQLTHPDEWRSALRRHLERVDARAD